MRFPYSHEPTTGVLILILILIVTGFLIPLPRTVAEPQYSVVLRIVLFGTAAIFGLWAMLQVLLRISSVIIADDHIAVQFPLTWRWRRIAFRHIQGYTRTRRGALAIVYLRQNPGEKPKKRLLVTPVIASIDALLALVEGKVPVTTVPAEIVLNRVTARRLIRIMLFLIAVLATPLYVVFIERLLYGFSRVF
ncbi:MAG TPA: hypothetical protein VMT34_13400 [Aggregatilineales bacterium]|nr:hypothetical protein [Aggregatilineales bacterium]